MGIQLYQQCTGSWINDVTGYAVVCNISHIGILAGESMFTNCGPLQWPIGSRIYSKESSGFIDAEAGYGIWAIIPT